MLPLLCPRPAPPYRWSTWRPAQASRCPGRGRPALLAPAPRPRPPPSTGAVSGHPCPLSVQTAPVSDVDTPRPHESRSWTPARTASSLPRCPAGRQAPPNPRRSVRPGVRTAPAVSIWTGARCPLRQGSGRTGVRSDRVRCPLGPLSGVHPDRGPGSAAGRTGRRPRPVRWPAVQAARRSVGAVGPPP
jgi:hypothetical protein